MTMYILNRCFHRALKDKTLEEAFTSEKVQVSLLCIFGCLVYIHVLDVKRIKFEPFGVEYFCWLQRNIQGLLILCSSATKDNGKQGYKVSRGQMVLKFLGASHKDCASEEASDPKSDPEDKSNLLRSTRSQFKSRGLINLKFNEEIEMAYSKVQ